MELLWGGSPSRPHPVEGIQVQGLSYRRQYTGESWHCLPHSWCGQQLGASATEVTEMADRALVPVRQRETACGSSRARCDYSNPQMLAYLCGRDLEAVSMAW